MTSTAWPFGSMLETGLFMAKSHRLRPPGSPKGSLFIQRCKPGSYHAMAGWAVQRTRNKGIARMILMVMDFMEIFLDFEFGTMGLGRGESSVRHAAPGSKGLEHGR